ncbi:MAG TPA: cation:proton antiporter, partial [Thermomicrobiales bacterium]|nr:cation:proton antiporter [Thermomicrobiales bacterium]
GGESLAALVRTAAVVCATVIAARVVWVFAQALWAKGPGAIAAGGWREATIIAWAGIRGGYTLAAALSAPLLITGGTPFPYRDDLIFAAFAVVVVTLVGQGLTLPLLIRWLAVAGTDAEQREERLARRATAEAALARLKELEDRQEAPPDLAASLRTRYEHQAALLADGDETQASAAAGHIELHQRLQRDLLAAEQRALIRLRDQGAISDQVLRRVERDLDLEEVRLEL